MLANEMLKPGSALRSELRGCHGYVTVPSSKGIEGGVFTTVPIKRIKSGSSEKKHEIKAKKHTKAVKYFTNKYCIEFPKFPRNGNSQDPFSRMDTWLSFDRHEIAIC